MNKKLTASFDTTLSLVLSLGRWDLHSQLCVAPINSISWLLTQSCRSTGRASSPDNEVTCVFNWVHSLAYSVWDATKRSYLRGIPFEDVKVESEWRHEERSKK